MAIKKSELYSSLWASCDELRGGMDASQYKDYVLVLLFMKYVSDKGGALVEIPPGGSFKDMVKLKGKENIGEQINIIIGELAKANDLVDIITEADFDNSEKLGSGKEKVERLSNLISIFENEALDFSGNRADDDDLLGDAYEYLMRHFATESGKSKGQFYTPAEVSRIIAKVIGITKYTKKSDSVYDPTCGSGSLLLKVAAESPHGMSIYGQEMDNATRALAVMNMWLHGNPTSDIRQGNTLASPKFLDEKTGQIKTFNYVVANPKFSDKTWTTGLDPANDIYERFTGYNSLPPKKQGDYAYLLHFIKSLKSKGKGAIVLPLGVLFRGNSEGVIRKNLIERGYIKGVIALPPNLFYGTGIAACIIVIDKEDAEHRKGIFMIDASREFIKDGNKNRLRERDIHKIVDTFNNQVKIDKYSRMIPISEIADKKNEYNLNIPRYIDSQEPEDLQDIEAHLLGGIPNRDIGNLDDYWKVYPTLKNELFSKSDRKNYSLLKIPPEEINNTIFNHPEFVGFSKKMDKVFSKWAVNTSEFLKQLDKGFHPKNIINSISESILETYTGKSLFDKYAMYQYVMDYWANTMQDDMYELADDGWKAGNEVKRKMKKVKKGDKEELKPVLGIEGLEGRLIPPDLIINVFFPKEKKAINDLEDEVFNLVAKMNELREEHGGEDGLLARAVDNEKINRKSLLAAINEIGTRREENAEEYDMLHNYKNLIDKELKIQAQIKAALKELEISVIKKYPNLSIDEIKTVVISKKWINNIESKCLIEMNGISYRLSQRIIELGNRYISPLPKLDNLISKLTNNVNKHLLRMNFRW